MQDFERELDEINADLQVSLDRLSAILEKSRSDLNSARLSGDALEESRLSSVVGELEKKLKELKEVAPSRQ